jgi:taurine dioxygenase
MPGIEWRALGAIGVEILADGSTPFTVAEQAELRQLYEAHHLLLFRDQQLDRASQIELVSLFGPVIRNDPSGFISNVRKDVVGENELVWHSDLIYTPEPHLGLSLYAVTADPGVSPTRFVDAEAVLARLPADLLARIGALEALHVSGGSGGSARNIGAGLDPDWPKWARPLVDHNPQTGHAFLAATLSQTSHVIGVSQAESDALLDGLFAVLYDPAAIVEHHWRTGDILIWDNLALQHSRDRLRGNGRRDLERVIFGGRTIFDQHPAWIERMRASLDKLQQETM